VALSTHAVVVSLSLILLGLMLVGCSGALGEGAVRVAVRVATVAVGLNGVLDLRQIVYGQLSLPLRCEHCRREKHVHPGRRAPWRGPSPW
jgi:hypothetical protein